MATSISGVGAVTSVTKTPLALCTKYKGVTPHFSLPVFSGVGIMGGPSTLSEYCERRYADIVENNLVGAIEMHNGQGVFELGDFFYDFDNKQVFNDDFRSYIQNKFVENLHGVDVEWNDVAFSSNPFLFVGLVENSDSGSYNYRSSVEFGDFVTRSSTSPVPAADELVVGRVISGNGAITITKEVPPEYAKSFTPVNTHKFETNPHPNWIQTTASTIGVAVSDGGVFDDVVIHSGLFNTFNAQASGGTIDMNGVLAAFSGIQVTGTLEAQNGIAGNSTDFDFYKFEFNLDTNVDVLLVNSGLDVFSFTDVSHNWVFDNSRNFATSGVGIRLISGVWNNKTSDGSAFDVYDPSEFGSVLYSHLGHINPHSLYASGIGVLSIFGDTLADDLNVASGVAIDGIDISELERFIDGSIIDNDDHRHYLLEPLIYQHNSPSYRGLVTSGIQPGALEESYDYASDRTYVAWYSYAGVTSVRLTMQDTVPMGAIGFSGVDVFARVGYGSGVVVSDTSISLRLFDTDNTLVSSVAQATPDGFRNLFLSGTGLFAEGEKYRIEADLQSDVGSEAALSDIRVIWETGS